MFAVGEVSDRTPLRVLSLLRGRVTADAMRCLQAANVDPKTGSENGHNYGDTMGGRNCVAPQLSARSAIVEMGAKQGQPDSRSYQGLTHTRTYPLDARVWKPQLVQRAPSCSWSRAATVF